MAFRYSITLASFRKIEPLEQTLGRLKDQKYDAVEMFGEPGLVNIKDIGQAFSSHGLGVSGITGMWGRQSGDQNRKLLSVDPAIVNHAEKYVKECVKMCRQLGGREINVCLFADNGDVLDANHQTLSEKQRKTTLERAIPVLSSLSKFAADNGVELLIEPLNRYSTPYCTSAKDALYIANKINQESTGVLLDTFHMNIEERSIAQAIIDSKEFLRHTHFADNDRSMPGTAHIDFIPIVKALREARYDRYISFEPNLTDANYLHATLDGLKFIQGLENSQLQ